ncbi:MAG: hypothetical protein INR70_01480 [Parafilimonas terrae]|jgi:hypothetical protein|nr:hypothetical protein [Parafilimonas terrae]
MTRDAARTLSRETEKVGARISKAFDKLTKKMRRRAEKAKVAMVASGSRSESAILQRRFEMYTNAADDLERVLMEQRVGVPSVGSFKETGTGSTPTARAVP